MSAISVRGATYNNETWRDGAACVDMPPDLFFPVGETGRAAEQIAEAKAVCAQCPVAEHCLDFALLSNQEFGIWGGCDEEERRQIRRQWRRERALKPLVA